MLLVGDRLVSLMSVSVVGFGLLFFYAFSSSGEGADVLDGGEMVICHFEVDEPSGGEVGESHPGQFHPPGGLV